LPFPSFFPELRSSNHRLVVLAPYKRGKSQEALTDRGARWQRAPRSVRRSKGYLGTRVETIAITTAVWPNPAAGPPYPFFTRSCHMFLTLWLKRTQRPSAAAKRRPGRPDSPARASVRPQVDQLEHRIVPSRAVDPILEWNEHALEVNRVSYSGGVVNDQ